MASLRKEEELQVRVCGGGRLISTHRHTHVHARQVCQACRLLRQGGTLRAKVRVRVRVRVWTPSL